jgi:adenylosuccinate lyase
VSVPNVLANRYAGADLALVWSPEHKIVLERQLWIDVTSESKSPMVWSRRMKHKSTTLT